MASFQFRKGERDSTAMLIGLAGASGSGKTLSAIKMGMGLAYPHMMPEEILATIEREGRSRVVVLDSEGGRALHYAPKPGQVPDFEASFPFEYGELAPPFTPAQYQDAVVAANEAGFKVVIVDSMSHEYESEGGVLEWADRLAEGVPKAGVKEPRPWIKDDWVEQPIKSPGNWKEPKRAHKIMVGRFLQCRVHLIFCLRAEEKMKLVNEKFTGNDGKERTAVKVIPAGERPENERWEPICEKRFMYEMTASFVLVPGNPGVPIPIKLQEQHKHCFPEGEYIGPKSGWCLADWASGSAKPDAPKGGEGKPEDAAAAWADKYIAKVAEAPDAETLMDLQAKAQKNLAGIRDNRPDVWGDIDAAHMDARKRLGL